MNNTQKKMCCALQLGSEKLDEYGPIDLSVNVIYLKQNIERKHFSGIIFFLNVNELKIAKIKKLV